MDWRGPGLHRCDSSLYRSKLVTDVLLKFRLQQLRLKIIFQ